MAAIPGAEQHFNLSTTLAILPGSLYAYGLSFGALIGTAACEIYGRRIVYQVSVPISLIFTILGGASKNYATLAVARSLAGLFSGPCLTVGAGIINDLWDVRLEKAGTSFVVLFVLCIVWATQAGPMISASVVRDQDWRWTFWVTAILVGIVTVWAFSIPETYHPQIVRMKAKREGREVENRGSKLHVFLVAIGRPLHMLIIEPVTIALSSPVINIMKLTIHRSFSQPHLSSPSLSQSSLPTISTMLSSTNASTTSPNTKSAWHLVLCSSVASSPFRSSPRLTSSHTRKRGARH